MSGKIKIELFIAAFLVVIGAILFAAVMAEYRWDFTKLSTGKYQTNTYEISEEFRNLSINTDTADIIFALSDDGKCRVECYEKENSKHSVTVEDDALVINVINKKSWYDYFEINFASPKITIYLPKAEYTSLFIQEDTGNIEIPQGFRFAETDISLSTGDIRVDGIFAGTMDLSLSTGDVTVTDVSCEGDLKINLSTGKTNLTDIACKNFISSGSTGNITLKNVIATERFTIERSTGDVKFDGSDAAEIFVKTDTGNVKGRLLTDKVFIAQTDTGSIDIPKTMTGGRCEITTDTGNIKITID